MAAPSAAAAGGASFSLRPERYDPQRPETQSYFVFDAAQGMVIQSEVRVINTGEAAGTATLYAVDATTGHTSGTVFRMEKEPRELAGTWVQMTASSLTLEPGESRLVSFTVSIPTDARAGHHVAGIVVQGVTSGQAVESTGAEGATFHVEVNSRMAVAVQINLPGPQTRAMEATRAYTGGSSGRQQLFLSLRNSGNLMEQPQRRVVVRDAAGAAVQDLSFDLKTVLPQTAIDYPLFIENRALDAGEYVAELTMTYGDGPVLEAELPFSVTEADLVQVFQGSGALEAPDSLGAATETTAGPPLSPFVIGLGAAVLVLLGIVGFLLTLILRQQRA